MKRDKLLVISLLLIFMVGCGSLSDGVVDEENLGVAYYVDSAVEGVEYQCGNAPKGTTNNKGKIIFEKGKGCKLYIGDKLLREISSSALIDNITLVERNDDNIQFLQTLDNDGDANNGIRIISGVADYFNTQEIATKLLPTFFTDLFTVNKVTMATLSGALNFINGYNGNSVDLDEAKVHVENTIEELKANNIEYKELF
jgi:hypothetical protein